MKYDNVPILNLLNTYFSGDKKKCALYLKKKKEKNALWRLLHYNNEELKLEINSFEYAKKKCDTRLERKKDASEIRSYKAWEDFDEANALRAWLIQDDQMTSRQDVYYLHLEMQGKMNNFSIGDYGDISYNICMEKDADDLAMEYVKDMIDGCGGVKNTFNEHFWMAYIDEEKLTEALTTDNEDYVRESPETFLEDPEDRELSDEQNERLTEIESLIESLQQQQSELNTENPEEEERWDEINDEISELEDEKQDITENPEGDWKEEAIERAVENRKYEIERNCIFYAKDYGLDLDEYIDIDELIEGAVDADGREHFLGTYDETEHEIEYLGNTYCIYRTN